jgi:hypothetical protein
MKKALSLFILTFIVASFAMVPLYSYAEDPAVGTNNRGSAGTNNPPPATAGSSGIPNPLGVNSIGDFFYEVVQVVLDIGYIAIAFFLILSGFKFVTAQGSDEKLTKAKETFYYTIAGALIIIGAQTIINIVRGIISGLNN